MAIWTGEINELNKVYSSFKGQLPDIMKELEQLIRTDDPNVVMLYSRRCLEVIVTDLCETELKRPRKTEPLKGIIDKLNSEEKVPSYIITSMLGLNSMANYGAHPKDFDPEQVRPVLNNLSIIIKWYLKYKDFQIVSKTEAKAEAPKSDNQNYKENYQEKEIVKPKKRTLHWSLKVILGLVLLFGAYFLVMFILFNKNNRELSEDNLTNEVKIGDQVWMAQNLRTTKFSDGTPIALVTDKKEWANLETPAFCWYNNNAGKYEKSSFGALYNWYVVNTGKLCPLGWHVPSDAEWTILLYKVGGEDIAGDELKEIGRNFWSQQYNRANNHSGFAAVGGGNRNMYGPFEEINIRGYLWSASDFPEYVNYPTSINIFSDASNVLTPTMDKKFGMSVRCIKDHNITDYDNNKYNTVQFSNQVWMAENLKTTRLKDGTPIPLVTDKEEWKNLKTPAYCLYDSSLAAWGHGYSSALRKVSGALYNWYAVNTGNLCPTGWHVSSDGDWRRLTAYFGGDSVAGDKLKSTDFWPVRADTIKTTTNESGFTALPGGSRQPDGSFYFDLGDTGSWWCSPEYPGNSAFEALFKSIGTENVTVHSALSNKSSGYSVRCVKD
jgi:uncharacterized protein (TIGR02145 family)